MTTPTTGPMTAPVGCTVVDDLAPEALERLLPQLGPLVGDPERVDGQHPDQPDQTFDYAAQRPDGSKLAIEITGAFDKDWLESNQPWQDLAAKVKVAVGCEYPAVTGFYVIAPARRDKQRAKDRNVDTLAGAVAGCFDGGVRASVVVEDVQLDYIQGRPDLLVESAYAVAEPEEGTESQARFRQALTTNVAKMRNAGEAGYETHLAVIHWVIGTTDGWRLSLAQNPPDETHPQYIWAVDLSAPGTQGRRAAERIWPLA
jgi:hypothetical protein